MTEYGRGPGSEPWHPEDPLYGDGGWDGQQAHAGQQSPYGGQPQQQYPQQPQQQQYGDWSNGQPGPLRPGSSTTPSSSTSSSTSSTQQQYGRTSSSSSTPVRTSSSTNRQRRLGRTGTSTRRSRTPPTPPTPTAQQAAAYGGEQPDFYGTPDAYPPPEPPGHARPRRAAARARPEHAPQRPTGTPAPTRASTPSSPAAATTTTTTTSRGRAGRGDRQGRGGKAQEAGQGRQEAPQRLRLPGGRRWCSAAASAGVSYFGYQFYQNRFGAAPDYAGDGTSETVTSRSPRAHCGVEIGQKLKDAGVVKSVDAFVAAQAQNPDGRQIQAGVYLLKKEMSAESAVDVDARPEEPEQLWSLPGQRNIDVYATIDKKLGLDSGHHQGGRREEVQESSAFPTGRTTTTTSRTRWKDSSTRPPIRPPRA